MGLGLGTGLGSEMDNMSEASSNNESSVEMTDLQHRKLLEMSVRSTINESHINTNNTNNNLFVTSDSQFTFNSSEYNNSVTNEQAQTDKKAHKYFQNLLKIHNNNHLKLQMQLQVERVDDNENVENQTIGQWIMDKIVELYRSIRWFSQLNKSYLRFKKQLNYRLIKSPMIARIKLDYNYLTNYFMNKTVEVSFLYNC